MTAVTGLSAAKTLDLLKTNIVNATLVGDNLTMHRRDGSSFVVGNVRGASGAAASEGAINAAVAAAIADLPKGALKFDSVGVNQAISANGGTWYTIATLSVTDTIVAGREYEIAYSATITSGTALLGLDLEVRVGGTFSEGTPLDRDTKFVYDSDKGIGLGGSAHFKGVDGSFEGAKTFLVGVRVSADSDLSVRNNPSDGGNNATLVLLDHGVL